MPGVRGSIRRDVSVIRASLRGVERALERLARRARKLERTARIARGVPKAVRRRMTITPQRRAQLKLQGQYMGYMRQLKPKQKAQVRAVKERGGYGPAIRLAGRLARG